VIFASSRETGRIPVIAVLGQPGSGKTFFLNHLLNMQAFNHSVVLTASEDKHTAHIAPRLQRLASVREASDSGCLCCGMRSELGDALRDIFLRALSKKSPPVARVIIEANTSDPGSLKFTLKHAPFLGQRYVFASTILLLDVGVLLAEPMNLRGLGIEYADYVVCFNAVKLSKDSLKQVELAVKQLNSKVKLALSVEKLEATLTNTLH
jgi:G3E family GTPase